MFWSLFTTVCYTISSLGDKYISASLNYKAKEYTFFVSVSTSLWLGIMLFFDGWKFAFTVKSKNLCIDKEVNVSSNETGNIGPNAVDGNSTTRWVAVDGTYPQWITVDLGEVYSIGDLTLEWDTKGGNRHYMYYVEVSVDGKEYTEVLDKRNNTTMGTITDSLNHAKGRYIRITATGCNVSGWATLFEIKADGYTITSDEYGIDDVNKKIIVGDIPDTGLAEGIFMSKLNVKGNYSYQVNLSSGWIHEGNTVDVFDVKGNKVATYTISSK